MLDYLHFQFNTHYFLNFVLHPQPVLLKGILLTITAAFISQTIGTIFGALLAVAGMSRFRIFRIINQVYIWFFRGTPVLVQLVLIYFGLPYLLGVDIFPAVLSTGLFTMPGALLAGIITFGLHEAAYMSEITRTGIISVERGQSEAAKALGMTPGLLMRRIILPQTIPVIFPTLGNQFNNMLKTTSLLSIIGVGEMFRVAEQMQAATFMTFEVYLGISVYYLLLTACWTAIQLTIEKRLSRPSREPSRKKNKTVVPASKKELINER